MEQKNVNTKKVILLTLIISISIALLSTAAVFAVSSFLGDDKKTESASGSGISGSKAGAEYNSAGGLSTAADEKPITVDFYVINDLHGKFDDSYGQPGVDELTTYLKERKVTDEHAIFLSSGDMWQGSAESNQTEGHVVIDWMNELGFVSMTLGNHEFDWGEEVIAQNALLAEFPFLAINVYDVETCEQVTYCKSSVLVDAGGVKIGIIGAIGDCYSSISAVQSGGFYIITGDELTQLVKEEALSLRAQGADFIVYSIHDGYSDSFYDDGSDFITKYKVMADSRLKSYYDTELSGDYVDLVFEGHTHQNYILMDTKGVYHLQDGGENEGISHVQVELTPHVGTSSAAQAEPAPHADISSATQTASANQAGTNESAQQEGYYTHECTIAEIVSAGYYAQRGSDSLRDEILERYSDELAFTKEVLGNNSEYLGRDELRTIVARLYYEAGAKKWADRYDIVLGGGFITVRDPRHLDAGDVTYAELQSLFPFDNELVLCSCSGYDLQRVFFNSMNSNYFICCSEYGESLRENGVDLNGTYYVVVDTYSSTYEPNNLTEIERYGEEIYARDLLAQMFAQYER